MSGASRFSVAGNFQVVSISRFRLNLPQCVVKPSGEFAIHFDPRRGGPRADALCYCIRTIGVRYKGIN